MEEKLSEINYSWGELYETLKEMRKNGDPHNDLLFNQAHQIFVSLDNNTDYKILYTIATKSKFTPQEMNRINSPCFDGICKYFKVPFVLNLDFELLLVGHADFFFPETVKFFLSKIPVEKRERTLKILFQKACANNNVKLAKFITTIIDKNIVKLSSRVDICRNGNEKIVDFLLSTYEDYDVNNFFIATVIYGNEKLAKYLVNEKGADIHYENDRAIREIIQLEKYECQMELFVFLIQKGMELDINQLSRVCIYVDYLFTLDAKLLQTIFKNREQEVIFYIFANNIPQKRTLLLVRLMRRLNWSFIPDDTNRTSLQQFFPNLITRCIELGDMDCMKMLLQDHYRDTYPDAENTIWRLVLEHHNYSVMLILLQNGFHIPEIYTTRILEMVILKVLPKCL